MGPLLTVEGDEEDVLFLSDLVMRCSPLVLLGTGDVDGLLGMDS